MVEKTDFCVFVHFYLCEVLDFWIEGILWRVSSRAGFRLDWIRLHFSKRYTSIKVCVYLINNAVGMQMYCHVEGGPFLSGQDSLFT